MQKGQILPTLTITIPVLNEESSFEKTSMALSILRLYDFSLNIILQSLLYKNQQYGDSALNPSRIFSKASAVEQLLVRIDDKLNRIKKGAGLVATDEDVIQDLIGYLVLLKIGLNKEKAYHEDSFTKAEANVTKTENDLEYAQQAKCPTCEQTLHGSSCTTSLRNRNKWNKKKSNNVKYIIKLNMDF